MSRATELTDLEKIEDESAAWIAKIDRSLTKEEESSFKQWITSSPDCYRVFYAMAKQWDNTNFYVYFNQKEDSTKLNSTYYKVYAVAASVLVCVILSLFVSFNHTEKLGNQLSSIPTYTESYSTNNELKKALLPDGSEMSLNARTSVNISYSEKSRIITLIKGEIFIKVFHEKSRPLIVSTNNRFVKAVGTEFNVAFLNENDIELTVVEGKVVYGSIDPEKDLLLDEKTTLIESGQQAILSKIQDKIFAKTPDEIKQAISWTEGSLVFDETPLQEVLLKLERYHPYKFVLSSPEMGKVAVTGYFKANDLEQFLLAMENNFNIEHKKEGNNIVLFYK